MVYLSYTTIITIKNRWYWHNLSHQKWNFNNGGAFLETSTLLDMRGSLNATECTIVSQIKIWSLNCLKFGFDFHFSKEPSPLTHHNGSTRSHYMAGPPSHPQTPASCCPYWPRCGSVCTLDQVWTSQAANTATLQHQQIVNNTSQQYYQGWTSNSQQSPGGHSSHRRSTWRSYEGRQSDGDEEDRKLLLLGRPGARSCWGSGKPRVPMWILSGLDNHQIYTWSLETQLLCGLSLLWE